MIVVENVSLKYERTILDRISFEVKSGETLGIVGKSGAGKSSLLKIIAGLLDVTSGQVSYNDERVKGPSERLVPGHPEIQLVNQDFKLDTFHTVEENIRECILYLPTNVRERFVDELIGLLELNDVRTQKAHTLSGGEQQRLSIVRALAREPKVLLLDEPFSHLDGRLRLKLITYLIELKQVRGTTIILVSHDGSDVLSLSDRIVLMKNGMIQRGGVPRKMYYGYRTLEEARLFGHVNSVMLNGKRTYFRPDEFEAINDEKNSDSIRVEFLHEQFHGPILHTVFRTMKNELITLYSLKSLKHVEFIQIKKNA
jgi:ABC-type multidrug transport system ATPase subunit